MVPAAFVSDLHLCRTRPDLADDLFTFLAGPARDLQALYILGDLFEYWIGDDDLDDPFNASVSQRLARLAGQGTALYFMAGNRDFLISRRFAEAAGVALLTEPHLIKLNGQRVALCHGDALCTDDHDYQQFRRQVRSPAWQQEFLAKPLDERRATVEAMRRQSEASKQQKSMAIMDVSPPAVDALIRQLGHPEVLIHGHTHRPARHLHEVEGRQTLRIVLSDWHGDGARCLMAGEPFPIEARP